MSAAEAESRNATRLSGKAYKSDIDDLTASTNVRVTDFDQKAVHFLDFLHKRGKVPDACKFLKETAKGVGRDDILNWRAYVYTLLRKSDEAAYQEMKAQGEKSGARGARKEKEPKEAKEPAAAVRGQVRRGKAPAPPALEADVVDAKDNLNPGAPEFVPGHHWGGRLVGTTPTAAAKSHPPFPLGVFIPTAAHPPPPPPGPPTIAAPAPAPKAAPAPKKAAGAKAAPKGKAAAKAPAAVSAGQEAPDGLPSVGSAGHAKKECKPCAFFHTKGCIRAGACEFCHLCGPGEKRTRKKGPSAKAAGGAPPAADGVAAR